MLDHTQPRHVPAPTQHRPVTSPESRPQHWQDRAQHIEQALYRSVLDHVNDGIVIIQDDLVQYCNPRVKQMTGWPLSTLIGSAFTHFVSPDSLRPFVTNYIRHLRGEAAPACYEIGLLCHDDNTLATEINTSVIQHNGRRAVLLIVRDISERKRAEAEREQLINELNSFAHTVAHDLKSPLHVLLGYASLVVETLGNPNGLHANRTSEYAKAIEQSGQKMAEIIDALLLLSKVQSGEDAPIAPLNMEVLVANALTRLDNRIQETNAQVEIASTEWPVVQGYELWIEQVWFNYISNGLKYGGESPHLTIGADPPNDDRARFWVRDRGIGIALEDQKRVFERFARVGSTRADGHGLGLSIVKRIITRLGGEVGVISAAGEGAEFFFTLPVTS